MQVVAIGGVQPAVSPERDGPLPPAANWDPSSAWAPSNAGDLLGESLLTLHYCVIGIAGQ